MEEILKIRDFKMYSCATLDQIRSMAETMRKKNRNELLLVPAPDNEGYFVGILLTKYLTPVLSNIYGVEDTKEHGEFAALLIPQRYLRGFVSTLTRRICSVHILKDTPAANPQPIIDDESFADKFAIFSDTPSNTRPLDNLPVRNFLKDNSPAKIQQTLNQQVIGQEDLTKAVSDFLYYHALRQLHTELPPRPLMISGPSGSGKTEVWRVANKLYGHIFPVSIIDGSSLSCDGWAGNFKIDTFVDARMVNGGILVVDEFDKLAKPKYSSAGENVSLDMQAEFLKLMEGEYRVTEKKKQTDMTSQRMGVVMVGAFEALQDHLQEAPLPSKPHIGFLAEASAKPTVTAKRYQIPSDEDFIAYGIMPEIVGRIAINCATAPLPDEAYINIIRGPHSRVARIAQILESYGLDVADLISDEELKALIASSKSNRTGVRWVSAQVESRLLEAIREEGLFPQPPAYSYKTAV